MKIVKSSFEVMAMSSHTTLPYQYSLVNPERLIEAAGRTCYKSDAFITEESSKNFYAMIQKKKHLTVEEHSWVLREFWGRSQDALKASLTTNWSRHLYFDVQESRTLVAGNIRAWKEAGEKNRLLLTMGTPYNESQVMPLATWAKNPFLACATVRFINDRGVSHETVRHRPPAISQESTRYVNYEKRGIEFVLPPWVSPLNFSFLSLFWSSQRNDYLWYLACRLSEFLYNQLIRNGWEPQKARSVLINSLKTELVVTATLGEWQHIFNQRSIGTTGKPHPQMQEIMTPVHNEFKKLCPQFF